MNASLCTQKRSGVTSEQCNKETTKRPLGNQRLTDALLHARENVQPLRSVCRFANRVFSFNGHIPYGVKKQADRLTTDRLQSPPSPIHLQNRNEMAMQSI